MTVQKKSHLVGQPHIQPPARRLPKKTVLGIAQSLSIRRKDAKPPHHRHPAVGEGADR